VTKPRDILYLMPIIAVVSAMITGAAIFAAGMAFMKFLGG